MPRYLYPFCIVAIVAAAGWWIDGQSRAPTDHTTPSPLPQQIYAAGRVEGVRPEAGLRPWEHGRVMQLHVQEGQQVAANQVLLTLDDEQHRYDEALAVAQWQRAQAELDRLVNGARSEERAEATAGYNARLAQLERARLTWKRTQSLHADGVVSHQQADDDRTRLVGLEAEVAAAEARMQLLQAPARDDELRAAQATVAAAKANVDTVRLRLRRRQLLAPFAGRVLQINIEPGEMAGPQSTEPAIMLADTSRLRVRAYVEELEAPGVAIGAAAQVIADGLPNQVFHGRVTQVSPRMGAKTVWTNAPPERHDTKTREVWIDLDSGEGLVVGLRVNVMIDKPADRDGVNLRASASVTDLSEDRKAAE